MPTDPQQPRRPAIDGEEIQAAPKHPLTPEAERALAEAAARRAAGLARTEAPKEVNGRGGLEPTRYGDWEINGLTADF